MQPGVYTKNNELITSHIRDAVPGYQSHKVRRQLLDGSWHMQVIGTGGRTLSLVIFSGREGKGVLDAAENEGDLIKVVVLNKTWEGFISEKIFWQETSLDYYRGEVLILVTGEGA